MQVCIRKQHDKVHAGSGQSYEVSQASPDPSGNPSPFQDRRGRLLEIQST